VTHCAAASRASVALCCAWLAACATAPPPAPMPGPDTPAAAPAPADDALAAFERRMRLRAAELDGQGRWAEAAFAWQVVVLLRPEHQERLAELKRRIETRVAERLQRARQAQARGDSAAAEQLYLAAVALQPDHAEAAASLRGIERERIGRDLGQPSRVILARRAPAGPRAPAPGPTASDSLELEQVSMLAGQGGVDEAIGILERRVAAQPRDDAARRLLANLHFRRAQALQAGDPNAARTALARCLRLDPGHAGAAALLKQLGPAQPAPAARPKAPRAATPR
jgi:tetratricopeptide (TPR) repeat protein